ncbi:TIGR03084 family metal-binding protein [Nocardia nova]|uniref:TIGR03084 family metal-binding protein n=1 Tax=Nocardia nova TaxID=37330 RepID=UPI0018937D1F|nr:TIGR03084 family metal-binding protein [Nocardia nova]MBF6150085.1 TIGR03084 family protein [Nocardia nova]MDN2495207.1 TIGR03084 family protein [Nocardia nova]
MGVDLTGLCADLRAEGALVLDVLEALGPEQWRLGTPATGWTIADQVSHLAYFDDAATLAVTDPERFRVEADELAARGDDFTEYVAARYRDRTGAELLTWFAGARDKLLETMAQADPSQKLPWFGPPMSAAGSLTARLMETWAHGLDIRDTLGLPPVASARLRHIAHLGYATVGWSFVVHGRPKPERSLRLELHGPGGTPWQWGPEDAADRIRGSALDFCLLVTQRRHRGDLGLDVEGSMAAEYVGLAQIFAGPPGLGRAPAADATHG